MVRSQEQPKMPCKRLSHLQSVELVSHAGHARHKKFQTVHQSYLCKTCHRKRPTPNQYGNGLAGNTRSEGVLPIVASSYFGVEIRRNRLSLLGWLFLQQWLSDMDSNHDKSLQRALCYRYTIGQAGTKITFPQAGRKGKFGRRIAFCGGTAESRGMAESKETQVVVLGAGFGGLEFCKHFRHAGARVTVVD